eukprot:321936-Chlamydomonas_euryale.AAC.2
MLPATGRREGVTKREGVGGVWVEHAASNWAPRRRYKEGGRGLMAAWCGWWHVVDVVDGVYGGMVWTVAWCGWRHGVDGGVW